MKQLTLGFPWFVQVFKDSCDKTPTIIPSVKAVSPPQAIRRATIEKNITGYDMKISVQGTFPVHY